MSLVGGSALPRETRDVPPPAAVRRSQRIAWLALGLGFALFCLLAYAAQDSVRRFGAQADEPATARVELAHGNKIELRRAGQKTWTSVAKDATLGEGDSVRTDGN
ncbi:MAG TPA: hypothetical protein VM536_10790, partial [Chloroflexia bacterium]|nr:hypothetical protein [Chloroflexia bacterium]